MRERVISTDSSASQVVGNLMTFSYLMGLTLGSLLSYWLDSLLDSPGSPCRGLGDQGTTSPRYHRSHQSPTHPHLPPTLRFHTNLGFHWSESFRPANVTY